MSKEAESDAALLQAAWDANDSLPPLEFSEQEGAALVSFILARRGAAASDATCEDCGLNYCHCAAARERAATSEAGAEALAFQLRVQPWMMACFGEEIAGDREERNHRFLEEALELVQTCGCSASEAHQLVDYVFGREAGEPAQEVGGVMVTLAALCLANGMDMHEAAEIELARIWTKVEKIRAKQAAKPKHSPLPAAPRPTAPAAISGEIAWGGVMIKVIAILYLFFAVALGSAALDRHYVCSSDAYKWSWISDHTDIVGPFRIDNTRCHVNVLWVKEYHDMNFKPPYEPLPAEAYPEGTPRKDVKP